MLKSVRRVLLSLSKWTCLFFVLINFKSHASQVIDDGDIIPPTPPRWEYFTINGVDSDNDGVRDDVELWVNETFEDTNARRALKSMAKIYQDMIKHYNNPAEYLKAGDMMTVRSQCINFVLGNISLSQAQYVWGKLEGRVLNNFWRSFIFKSGFKHARSGARRVPDTSYYQFVVGCDFKVKEPEKIMQGFLKTNPEYKWTKERQQEFKDMYENYNRYDALDLFRHK